MVASAGQLMVSRVNIPATKADTALPFNDLDLEVISCYFCPICSLKQSQKPTQFKGGEDADPVSVGEVSRSRCMKSVGRKIFLWSSLEESAGLDQALGSQLLGVLAVLRGFSFPLVPCTAA